MAESQPLRRKFEEHLTCSVCLEPFKDPKVLPCLHSYCHNCIVNLVKEAKPSNTIHCPECRLAVEVDAENTITLPSNFFVNNLLATLALTNENLAVREIVCGNCDNEEVVQNRCNECGYFLCKFCTEAHKRFRSTRHHELLTMEELKSNPNPHNIAEKIRCQKHKEEIIKLFCKTCQTTICRDCTIVDHQGHKYDFVEAIAGEEKRHLKQNLNEVKQRKSRVAEGIANLKKFTESLEATQKSTISEINKHFDELAQAVESRRKEMVEKATALTNSRQKQIHAQSEGLEVALASCESGIEFTEQAFKNGNDVQILSMQKYILQSLEQLKTVQDQTQPCVKESMMFVIPSSAQETKKMLLNAEYDVDVAVAIPRNCKAFFEEVETPLTPGQRYAITLICNNENNRRLRHGGQIIKPSFSGMDVHDVAVTDNKDGSYTISFRPRQGGMLKFEVSVDGVSVPNCSLTKKVKWVISNAHGKGDICNNGLKMSSVSRFWKHCCRVGGCYFESGVHTWNVRVCCNDASSFNTVHQGDVGIIDYDEINGDITKSRRKWVYRFSLTPSLPDTELSLTLDMEKRTLTIIVSSDAHYSDGVENYQFIARRVSPFFSCSSPNMSLEIVE